MLWFADKVEQQVPHSFNKRDLFGCIDIVAVGGGLILGVQATSDDNFTARVTKAVNEPRLGEWLKVRGAYFEVWGWAKRGPRGKVKHWRLRRVSVLHDHTPECKPLSGNSFPFSTVTEPPVYLHA
jgi:hypothetical protein